jgi:hypothetical protein
MRSLARVVVLALALLAAAAPTTASLPSIGVYFDPECATCSATASVGIPIDLYVNAQLGGWLPAGTVGAEFRIDGMPADWWVLSITPNPAATVVLGNPWTGCNIAFQDCQGPAGGCINLYVIRVLPVSVRSNVHLQVNYHSNPSCPNFCCIKLTACDAPYYTSWCAGGGQAWINGPACTVGVSAISWGSVKRLYD